MKRGSKKWLWLLVTDDEYELPLYVCDTKYELAEYCGTTPSNIQSAVFKAEKKERKFSRYRRVLREEK